MQKKTKTASGRLQRTHIVWLCFFGAMTMVIGLLALGDSGLGGGNLVAANVATLGEQAESDPIFRIDAPLQPDRWKGIVIHHLGRPAGDAEYVHRLHQSYGYQGMGYHFLIGNGNGLGDGIIQLGYRWNEQLPGSHVAGNDELAIWRNEHFLGICLIGNGDRRTFTDEQMRSLNSLVIRLQQELDIPKETNDEKTEGVFLHRELVQEVASPGRFFPTARFKEQLLN